MNEWISVEDRLPDDGMVVMTKISDDDGERNKQPLQRKGNLWFTPDGKMYVYYIPTHWQEGQVNLSTIKTFQISDGLIAIVENADGKKYLLTADSVKEVLEDWNGDCKFVPANDAKVYFAMFNNRSLSSDDCSTFEYLIGYMQGYYHL